jgi:hypothetical protein
MDYEYPRVTNLFRLQSGSTSPQIKGPRIDVYEESLSSCGPNKVHPSFALNWRKKEMKKT